MWRENRPECAQRRRQVVRAELMLEIVHDHHQTVFKTLNLFKATSSNALFNQLDDAVWHKRCFFKPALDVSVRQVQVQPYRKRLLGNDLSNIFEFDFALFARGGHPPGKYNAIGRDGQWGLISHQASVSRIYICD